MPWGSTTVCILPPCSCLVDYHTTCHSAKQLHGAGSGLGSDGIRPHRADIPVTTWGIKGLATFDATVISPLNSSLVSEAGECGPGARAAKKKEEPGGKGC